MRNFPVEFKLASHKMQASKKLFCLNKNRYETIQLDYDLVGNIVLKTKTN